MGVADLELGRERETGTLLLRERERPSRKVYADHAMAKLAQQDGQKARACADVEHVCRRWRLLAPK